MQNNLFRQFILSLALLTATAISICAQPHQGNRWLIVTDTSLSMERRSAATQTAVERMLLSGMYGQLRSGDTIGMWTFNEQLYSGAFPLQLWLPESRPMIAARAGQFIKQQKYEKTARFDKVIPAINQLVTNSDVITVILITDGTEKIAGTPYDDILNKVLKQDYGYQKKINSPFVIALRGEGGTFSSYRVTHAPWPVALTPLPPAPEVVRTIESETPPERIVEPMPAPVVPSLIVTGVKPETGTTPEAAAPRIETPAVITLNPEPIATIAPPPITMIEETVSPAPVPENPTVTPELMQATATPPPALEVAEVKPLTAPQVETLPAREVVVAATSLKENTPAPSPSPAKEIATPTVTPAPNPPVETPAPKTTSVQAVVVTPIGANSGSQKTLLIGLGLLAVALVLGIFLLRRPRHAGQASLITKSLDKDKRDL